MWNGTQLPVELEVCKLISDGHMHILCRSIECKSEECIVDKPLEHKEESRTVTEKKKSLDSAELMSHYLSKPPEWSLSLCVT